MGAMDLSIDTKKSAIDNGGESVAIVGMACVFPKAPDLDTYWRNILNKVDAVAEVPPQRWDAACYYNPDAADCSQVYARRGGYLESPLSFDAAEFGIMPAAVKGGEPDQFLVLKVAAEAMRDAGIDGGPVLERTDFILGRGAYLGTGAFNLLQRSFVVDQTVRLVGQLHPEMAADDLAFLRSGLLSSLLPFEADTAPAVMPNISAGRVANRLGMMGPNYNIDAACASSLFAVDIAVANLLAGRCDLALAGGVHIFNQPPFLSVFCALGAMSRQDCIRPFDKNADGLLPGEGMGLMVLKRRSEAERDGNRIYALIRGVGTSSDGRGGSVAAPRVAGELLALQRAYENSGVSPDTIGLIEAHGTATKVGDASEIETLATVFGPRPPEAARHCALGTVKSMIGHAMPAAGIAGLIKAALSLYHKVLPPTLHCDEPNPKFQLDRTPLYINTETRPWFKKSMDVPRRAGVNAFGFGGVNAHVVLEEYTAGADEPPARGPAWDAALFLFSGQSQADLARSCEGALQRLAAEPDLDIFSWSGSLVRGFAPGDHQLAIIAESPYDLVNKLRYAHQKLGPGTCKKIKDVKGIYYFADPLGTTGKLAFMFSGEGSPYTNMLLDLCLFFPEVRKMFESVDQVIASRRRKPRFLPSEFIFPATLLSPGEQECLAAEFWKVDSGLQAILGASFAMKALLARFGIQPDMIVGHSAGEYCAWIASGITEIEALYRHQEQIAAIYETQRHPVPTAMAAVSAGAGKIAPILEKVQGRIYISNDNCPHQVVVVGEVDAMDRFKAALKVQKILFTDLPSREVHHTPMAAGQAEAIFKAFGAMQPAASRVPVYSAITSAPYPGQADQVLRLMVDYWLKPLNFRQTVEAMHRDGARLFIEVGPGNNLCGFVDDTLRGRPFMSVAANNSRRSGITQFCHLLGMLVAQHVPVSLQSYTPLTQKPAQPDKGAGKGKGAILHIDLGLREPRLRDEQVAHLRQRLNARAQAPQAPAQTADKTTPPYAQGVPDEGGPPSPVSARSNIMQRYMDNMACFLNLQKEMVGAWTAPRTRAPRAPTATERPFVGRVKSLVPNQSCLVERMVSLREDRFLEDHTFAGKISETDPRLLSLVVTPMTVNLEIMAEAASLLAPDRVLLEIKSARANRWVEVPEGGIIHLQVDARQTPEGIVHTRLLEAGFKAPSAEVKAVFGQQYPPAAVSEPVTPECITPEAARRAREIYTQRWMSHGPRFQVIVGWTQIGASEVEAYLRAPEQAGLFATMPAPRFLLNPLLLDACAQLTGHWAQIGLREKYVTFPAGLQNARFFSAPPAPGELLRCRMRIREIDDNFVWSNFKITGADGRKWAIIQGWAHHRFSVPTEYYHFTRSPAERTVSNVIETGAGNGAVQCRVSHRPELRGTIWKKVISHIYLNRAERSVYLARLNHDEEAADRWLMGRVAAKDMVRHRLMQARGLALFPADFELVEEGDRLVPRGQGLGETGQGPAVAVTHTEEYAAARVLDHVANREQEILR